MNKRCTLPQNFIVTLSCRGPISERNQTDPNAGLDDLTGEILVEGIDV
jgi:hypothetical protein